MQEILTGLTENSLSLQSLTKITVLYIQKAYGKMAYIIKAKNAAYERLWLLSCYQIQLFLLNLGLETLAVRMKQYCENAMIVAKYLEASDKG